MTSATSPGVFGSDVSQMGKVLGLAASVPMPQHSRDLPGRFPTALPPPEQPGLRHTGLFKIFCPLHPLLSAKVTLLMPLLPRYIIPARSGGHKSQSDDHSYQLFFYPRHQPLVFP